MRNYILHRIYGIVLVGNITTTENGSLLNIEHAKVNDAGEYQCRFHNRIGSVTAEFEVEVTASEQNINGIVVAVCLFLPLF